MKVKVAPVTISLVFLLIFIAAGILYATRYVGVGWVGVSPILAEHPLLGILSPILGIVLLIVLAVAVYLLRGAKE